jgi:hypothetical protein
MSRKNIHKVLVSLNHVCKKHANINKTYAPKVDIKKQEIKIMNNEITKLMNYLKHPHYSYLYK